MMSAGVAAPGLYAARILGTVSVTAHSHAYFTGAASGMKRWPNTGSLCGVGGNSQAPVEGGRTSASTCTSSRNGLLAFTAWSSAPRKSCDLVTVSASTPAAFAQAAKSGLNGFL